jgi:hypothetical protein
MDRRHRCLLAWAVLTGAAELDRAGHVCTSVRWTTPAHRRASAVLEPAASGQPRRSGLVAAIRRRTPVANGVAPSTPGVGVDAPVGVDQGARGLVPVRSSGDRSPARVRGAVPGAQREARAFLMYSCCRYSSVGRLASPLEPFGGRETSHVAVTKRPLLAVSTGDVRRPALGRDRAGISRSPGRRDGASRRPRS